MLRDHRRRATAPSRENVARRACRCDGCHQLDQHRRGCRRDNVGRDRLLGHEVADGAILIVAGPGNRRNGGGVLALVLAVTAGWGPIPRDRVRTAMLAVTSGVVMEKRGGGDDKHVAGRHQHREFAIFRPHIDGSDDATCTGSIISFQLTSVKVEHDRLPHRRCGIVFSPQRIHRVCVSSRWKRGGIDFGRHAHARRGHIFPHIFVPTASVGMAPILLQRAVGANATDCSPPCRYGFCRATY